MANILRKYLPDQNKKTKAVNGLKPYLYNRNYQSLSIKTFQVKDKYFMVLPLYIDNDNFKVDVEDYLDYEKWKLEYKDQILQLYRAGRLNLSAIPEFRESLVIGEDADEL